MNALDIARAACMEVGANPAAIWWFDNSQSSLVCAIDGKVELRACWLAEMAVFGPHYVTHCIDCFTTRRCTPDNGCTPVRDVLRNVTCSR